MSQSSLPSLIRLGLATIVLVAIALAVPNTFAIEPGAAMTETFEPSLRVMSFNIRYGTANDGENRWENRRDLVAEVIKSSDAGLIGLQEALKFQIDQILEDVPGYQLVGVGRDDGREAGEYAAILVRTDRFEVLDQETFWFSDTPSTPGSTSWGNSIPRICTRARVRHKATDRLVDIYNVHFDHRSAESRYRSAALLAERIGRSESDGVPVVVTGDFNAGEDSDPIQFLKGSGPGPDGGSPLSPGLVDTFRQVQPEAETVGTYNGFVGRDGGAKIDYVFVRAGQFEVSDAAIDRTNRDGQYPSDHNPVTATLVLVDRNEAV